ncbi:MAG: aminotransferase class I/II-fold pyridoxal phosphate-dependent enzyme [Lachnospiraceae bacterium]|nr:aminotransferase class I/II-fold pyridoxal phosphate-dependent enzyme [Lachnospiraceae bacterium]
MQLIRKLKEKKDSKNYPFHMPGHKRMLAGDELLERICGIDVTETDDLDNLHDAKGILKEAQEHAAKVFGSDETYFLVNGSTGGILAAINGSVTTGDDIVIAANCHRSVYNAAMLSGATSHIITPGTETFCDINAGITAAAVAAALKQCDSGNRKAVVITSPTYEGITSDIKAIADVCHKEGAVLIVDAAHGAHLGFSEYFPDSPIGIADVVVTSVHKTLPAMTQTALIHIKKDCPAKDRIRQMLSVFMTSSPSYVLMASIDSVAYLLEDRGPELFAAYEARLDRFYDIAKSFNNLSILCREKLTDAGSADFDRSKIVVSDLTGSLTGSSLCRILHDQYDISIEMAADTYVILMTSIADTDEGFDRLISALSDTDRMLEGKRCEKKPRGIIKRTFDRIAIGRIKEVLFDGRKSVPIEKAEGKTAADFVSIYPPGIPVILPGEVITKEKIETVVDAVRSGRDVPGLIDGEIAVTWERYST